MQESFIKSFLGDQKATTPQAKRTAEVHSTQRTLSHDKYAINNEYRHRLGGTACRKLDAGKSKLVQRIKKHYFERKSQQEYCPPIPLTDLTSNEVKKQ